jgi:hypothetical protein
MARLVAGLAAGRYGKEYLRSCEAASARRMVNITPQPSRSQTTLTKRGPVSTRRPIQVRPLLRADRLEYPIVVAGAPKGSRVCFRTSLCFVSQCYLLIIRRRQGSSERLSYRYGPNPGCRRWVVIFFTTVRKWSLEHRESPKNKEQIWDGRESNPDAPSSNEF